MGLGAWGGLGSWGNPADDVSVNITESLRSIVESSSVSVGDINVTVTEVLSPTTERSQVRIEVSWVDKPKATTIWIDKG